MTLPNIDLGHGSGSSLPLPVLAIAGICTVIAATVSGLSIWLQLRNYRKPLLQRMVVRIMVMVPLYAVSSLISLFSLEAAFFIDVIRDIYEAFVIYCFFVLLLDYLGGERSLLILLHGRPPLSAVFPVSLWRNDIDPSDPYTFLSLKRGILQYVQIKPLLALASLIMKATGTYNEGDFRARSGYLYVSIVYNVSICLALWCLAVFWMCVHEDLKPFRPVPKFLCVKGILFFSFWQSIAVSFLVAVGAISRLGPYTDREHISVGLSDTLICIEMPFFAAAHMYAFSYRDFVQPPASSTVGGKRHSPIHVARMTLGYALRDAFGLKDLVEDTRATLRGEGINYRAFEPSEGGMHIGVARDRRIRAGLRYAAGGKRKYWLPEVRGLADNDTEASAPLFAADAEDVVHDAPDFVRARRGGWGGGANGEGLLSMTGDDGDVDDGDDYALTFSDALAGPEGVDEASYEDARRYVFGDYSYPVVDVSSEEARWAMWEDDERAVREIASGVYDRRGEVGTVSGYGATQSGERRPKKYDDGDDGETSTSMGVSAALRTPRTPSPPRSRGIPGSRPSSRQSHVPHSNSPTPAQGASRLHLPRLLSPSIRAVSSTSSTSSTSVSKRPSSRTSRTPLAKEDAVDLVVSAPADGLQVPAPSRGGHSPRSPVLIRVWDEGEQVPEEQVVREQEEVEVGSHQGRAWEAPDVRFVITTDDGGGDGRHQRAYEDGAREEVREGLVREQTPPPYARVRGNGFGTPEEEMEEAHNPWA